MLIEHLWDNAMEMSWVNSEMLPKQNTKKKNLHVTQINSSTQSQNS